MELQRKIAFGARGHAAVLDRSGKVIAHPFQHWIDSQFDLSRYRRLWQSGPANPA